MTEIACPCGAVLASFEFGVDPVPVTPPRCDACAAHVKKADATCSVCGIVMGTMEVDDRLPAPNLAANTCGACSRGEEDGA